MHAYAAFAKVNPDFADHDWAVANLKEEGKPNDFSTVWTARDSDVALKEYDDAVYFYGGRDAIYKALAKFEDAVIRNHARGQGGRRDVPIHVFSAVVRTLGGRKQIIMLAAADARRDADLAAFRAQDLEEADTAYRMREFRQRMKQKWPDIG
jgi:hypothetical protein